MGEGTDRRLAAVMFTDMVGYTALVQADEDAAVTKRDQYWSALEQQHDALDGTIVQRLGDGSMSMFPSALAAVQAGVEVQRRLLALDVPVRIGIHVGEVIVEPERLTGVAVNIAARIESFAVPGGVMLSDSAFEQIGNRGDVELVALGRFKLKNVGRPFELYAVAADAIVVPDAGALDGKGERLTGLPDDLPGSTGPLLGRAEDLEALTALARAHRLVTVTGPGGVGKTSLLVELGHALRPSFDDGVAFVALADVSSPEGFLPALAEALGVKEAEERTMAEGLALLIGDAKALLLLDNLEQLVAAAPHVAWLLDRCPALHVVTTSRAPLRLAAEHEYALSPLALPAPSGPEDVETLLSYPAIALFVERARSSKSAFELTADNAPAVAAVCRRLDGLPLALELAAARLRLLSPESLVERLGHALDVLTTGRRDSHARHQTLRATIDWSHSLLTEPEQRLFRRMAVFTGGCTVEDLEAVCAEPGESLLDEVESLVEKGLVQVDASGDRLRMLQTIQEYARERLEAADEQERVALAHAQRYAVLAEQLRDGIEGADQVRSLRRGVADEGNVLTALDTLLRAARSGSAAARETGMQITGDLLMYWHLRGKNLTARDYSNEFLETDPVGAPSRGRVGALLTAGLASWMLGLLDRANAEWDEAHRMATQLGADRALCLLGFCRGLGRIGPDAPAGLDATAAGIERSRAIGFPWAEAFCSTIAGILHALLGDSELARERYGEALAIQQRLGDEEGAGLSLGGLAQLAAAAGDLPSALDLYARSLAAFEAIGDRAEEARILSETAWTQLQAADPHLARWYFLESAQAYTDVASVRGVGLSLIGLAAVEAVEGRPANAVRIAAAAEVYAHEEGIVNVYSDETPGRTYVDTAREALSAEDAERADAAGRSLTITQALDLARLPVLSA
ncbi:MAG TPA: tetratricopeptide repeat protein [Mycobacteriales bacterium]|nr:tetratricopeptide repeat protein [Mycobacteriales bacterium]